VENSIGVSQEFRCLDHARVLPDGHLVVGEPVGADKLLVFGGPEEGTDLKLKRMFLMLVSLVLPDLFV
jgi:hypothetical protein